MLSRGVHRYAKEKWSSIYDGEAFICMPVRGVHLYTKERCSSVYKGEAFISMVRMYFRCFYFRFSNFSFCIDIISEVKKNDLDLDI
jgi:hypothetical protein